MNSKLKTKLYFALFPKKCLCCGGVIEPRFDYHEGCREKMPFITGERCEACGAAKADCACGKGQRHYESLTAPFYYEGGAKRALIKAKQYPVYTRALAKECVEILRACYGDCAFDCVTSVPMAPAKKRADDFDHAAALAQEIARLTGLHYEPLLRVVQENQAQHSLKPDLRAGNVRGIYDVLSEAPVRDQNILLVDDIKTSGATLDECALMLKLYDAASVRALTVAVGRKKKEKN